MEPTAIPPLPADLLPLLEAERAAPAASSAARERVAARLAATLGIPLLATADVPHDRPPSSPPSRSGPADPGGGGGGGAGASAPPPGGLPGWARLALVGGTVAVAGIVAWAVWPSPEPAPVSAPAPRAPAPRPAAPSTEPAAAAADRPSPGLAAPGAGPGGAPGAAPSPGTAPAGATPGGGDLAAERALLDGAQAALARKDGGEALARVSEHARRFPYGKLAEERETLGIRAHVLRGEADLAKKRAVRFRIKYPSSIFTPAVDATLRSAP